MNPPNCPSSGVLESLRERISQFEGARRPGEQAPVSTACAPLDRLLPGGGLARGTLVEWLAAGEGAGAESLAFQTAREACRQTGALVVIDREGEFYPPAAIRLGLAAAQIVVVQPRSQADFTWALDQALRCPAAAATLAWVDRLDGRNFRRLQLAAEQAATLGLLVRPAEVRGEPSWADVRLLVEPLPSGDGAGRRLKIHLLRCRGGVDGRTIEVLLDDETRGLHLVPGVGQPTRGRRAAGA